MYNQLPQFQRFLIESCSISQKYAGFYAYWVSKFIIFTNQRGIIDLDKSFRLFCKHLLQKKDIADWQVNQAKKAINIYQNDFLQSIPDKINSVKRSFKDEHLVVINRLRKMIRIKHYSYRTEKSYIGWIKRFFYYRENSKYKNSTQDFDAVDVKDYLTYLAVERKVSASTQNQALNALLFLYRHVLGIDLENLEKVVRARRRSTLPVVLSPDEIQKLFNNLSGKNLLILQIIYGAGLRLREFLRLRIKDIDFNNHLIFIRSTKGNKDRATILPKVIIESLIKHIELAKFVHNKDLANGYGEVFLPKALQRKYPQAAKQFGWQYLFPSSKLSVDPLSGKIRRYHISEKVVRTALAKTIKKAGIIKHVTVHTLRHSFATHLLMKGVNIRQIQELLGHKNLETTMVYTHVIKDLQNAPKSPVDELYESGGLSHGKKYFLKTRDFRFKNKNINADKNK